MNAFTRLAGLILVAVVLCSCKTGGDVQPGRPNNSRNAPTLFMIGDSTMADKPLSPAQPERGWGQLLPLHFVPELRIVNLAKNGRSSKSFRDEGLWQPVLDGLQPGDFVIIQFGHNDNKKDPGRATTAFGTFKENLARYIRETRERKGRPILATPVVRRVFTNQVELVDTHGDFAVAARRVAVEQDVPLLELEAQTAALVTRLGPERSKQLYMWVNPGEFAALPKKVEDNTHLNAFGASRVCDLAVEEIKNKVPELAAWLNPGVRENPAKATTRRAAGSEVRTRSDTSRTP